MPALREVQRAMAAAVLRRDADAAVPGALQPCDPRYARRLAVYRANARENFAAALEAAYPALLRQLGAGEFRSLAWSFQQRHPSPAGNLFEAGRALPGFIARHVAGTAEAWQSDLAALEWAVQEALVAADADGRFDAAALAALAPADHAALRFELHPSVRRVACAWRVRAAWEAAGTDDAPPAVPVAGDEALLVHRSPAGIAVRALDPAADAMLAGVLRGDALGALAEAALARQAGADPGAVLSQWAAAGVLTGWRLPA